MLFSRQPEDGQKKPQVSTDGSPSLSQYGRSPSLQLAPPAYTTHDLVTMKYQRIYQVLHWAKITVAILTLGISVAVIGCSGAALTQYSSSMNHQDWLLPLWPVSIDLRPAQSLLAVAVVTTVLSLLYLGLAALPIKRKVRVLNITSTLSSFLGLGLCLFALIFASIVTSFYGAAPIAGSLVSWTCKWQGEGTITPTDFTQICNHGSAALDLVLALTMIQAAATGLTGAGWWIEFVLTQRGAVRKGSQIELV